LIRQLWQEIDHSGGSGEADEIAAAFANGLKVPQDQRLWQIIPLYRAKSGRMTIQYRTDERRAEG
jgi:hypothetical protein